MQILRYLLFVVLSLGWANIILAENSYGPDNEEINETVDKGVQKGIPQNDEDGPDPNQQAPLTDIIITAPESEEWEMRVESDSITLRPTSHTEGTISGGPYNGESYTLQEMKYFCTDEDVIVGVTYCDSSYSCEEAIEHTNGKSVVWVTVVASGPTDNPDFEEFQEKMHEAVGFGGSTKMQSGKSFSFLVSFHDSELRYKYGEISCTDEDTGESYNCIIDVIFPNLKDANYISEGQKKDLESVITCSSGNPMDTDGKKLLDVKEGKGIQLHPV